MTRETKIGLLVGLAFIIVVGILLSDHMTTTIEPASASLQLAGTSIRDGLGQPSSDDAAPIVSEPKNVSPVQVVPTRDELNPRARQTKIAKTEDGGNVPVSLAQVAKRAGEQLVDTDGQPIANDDVASEPPVKAAASSYTAEPGDSLSRMALKLLGANTRANRQAIIDANPSLKQDPDRIIVGKSYVVPNGVRVAVVQADAQPVKSTAIYSVKPGDSLWSIAVNEVGNASAISSIKEMNQDVLRGSNQVRANMKLRLPAKQS